VTRRRDNDRRYRQKTLLARLRQVLEKLTLRMQTRLQSQACAECSRPILCWNRRTRTSLLEDQRWVHLVCSRRRLRSQQYSEYLQTTPAESQYGIVSGISRDVVLPALRELRQLRSKAFALRQRVERLERSCQQSDDSDLNPKVFSDN
jgi:hypothetical protein